jgi:hypothetical protein
MAKQKATAEELEARAESNGYKRGAHLEKDGTRDNGKHGVVNLTVLDRWKCIIGRYHTLHTVSAK